MAKSKIDLADALRKAIKACGLSANQLAKETGIPQTVISRFLRGFDMSMERGSKIAAYLGLELTDPARWTCLEEHLVEENFRRMN